ncbi:G-box-binding factor 4 [Apostasia shenzhenica]|uniref:G-box-binding factor 4 n=1 Tax=Apostasia shenzhenica TaxID=1088818 RepID=A0A2H9ZUM3_9ASPA|nr:G-box-binding factor 4 [Apostasia shenzhenica]
MRFPRVFHAVSPHFPRGFHAFSTRFSRVFPRLSVVSTRFPRVALPPPPADGIAGGHRCPAGEASSFQEVTLEDYLTRTGRVRAGEGKGPPEAAGRFVGQRPGGQLAVEDGDQIGGVAAGGGRGRKRAMVDQPDRTALQRQKRMIKNRESAARSRERRQVRLN